MSIMVLLTYVLSNKLQSVITKPVITLAQTMQKVSSNADFSLRVEERSMDEVGTLIEGFNTMLGVQLLADQCHSIEKTLRNGGKLQDTKKVIDRIEIMCQSAIILLRSEFEGEVG